MSRGIFYIAVGEDYLKEATFSARSLREVMPNENIAVITDQDRAPDCFDEVIDAKMDDGASGYDHMVSNMRPPYDRSIFIASDTHIAHEFNEIFDLLDQFDMAAVQKPDYYYREEHPVPSVPESFPEYNTGVIAFKDNDRVRSLIEEWKAAYLAGEGAKYHDQPALRRVIYESDVRIATLPLEYNCFYSAPGHVSRLVRILHGRPSNRLITTEEDAQKNARIAERMNEYDLPRVYMPTDDGVKVEVRKTDFYLYHSQQHEAPLSISRLADSIRREGVLGAFRRGVGELRRRFLT